MSLDSLSFVGLQGYVLYRYTSARCLYLVDRSWYIVVPVVGIFLFSMLRTLHRFPCFAKYCLLCHIYVKYRWGFRKTMNFYNYKGALEQTFLLKSTSK